jgi:hypothetical protein
MDTLEGSILALGAALAKATKTAQITATLRRS